MGRESGNARWQILIIEAPIVLFGGMFIGICQSIAARKRLSQPGLWISTNMLGVFAFATITFLLMRMPFVLKSYILKFFYALDLDFLVEARDLLLLRFLFLSVPVVATFTLIIPTGKFLLKYGVPSLGNQEGIGNKINSDGTSVKAGSQSVHRPAVTRHNFGVVSELWQFPVFELFSPQPYPEGA